MTDQNVDRQIGARIKTARLERALAPSVIAAELDIDVEVCNELETGTVFISSNILATLSAFFDKPVSWFFDQAVNSIDAEDVLSTLKTDRD